MLTETFGLDKRVLQRCADSTCSDLHRPTHLEIPLRNASNVNSLFTNCKKKPAVQSINTVQGEKKKNKKAMYSCTVSMLIFHKTHLILLPQQIQTFKNSAKVKVTLSRLPELYWTSYCGKTQTKRCLLIVYAPVGDKPINKSINNLLAHYTRQTVSLHRQ